MRRLRSVITASIGLMIAAGSTMALAQDAPVELSIEVDDDETATKAVVTVTNRTATAVPGVLRIDVSDLGEAVAVLEADRTDVITNMEGLACAGPADAPIGAGATIKFTCEFGSGRADARVADATATLLIPPSVVTAYPDGVSLSVSGTNRIDAQPLGSAWNAYFRWGGEDDNRPVILDAPAGTACLLLNLDTSPGSITDEAATFAVTATCVDGTSGDPPKVQLAFCAESGHSCLGLSGGRELSGTISLVPNSDAGDIEVTVQRRHGFFPAAGAILLGLVIGAVYVAKRSGTGPVATAVALRVWQLRTNALRNADGLVAGRRISDAVAEATNVVLTEVKRLRRRHLKADKLKASDRYQKRVQSELDSLDELVDSWPALKKVRDDLEAAWTHDTKASVQAWAPKFADAIQTMVGTSDKQLSLKGARDYKTDLPLALGVVSGWNQYRLDHLADVVKLLPAVTDTDRRKAAADAWDGFVDDLSKTGRPQAVETLLGTDLPAASQAIRLALKTLPGGPGDAQAAVVDGIAVEMDALLNVIDLDADSLSVTVPALRRTSTPEGRQAALDNAEDRVEELKLRLTSTQWLLLFIALGAALAAGLATLYVDKNWGSAWNYVAALTYGVTAGALVEAIVEYGLRLGGEPRLFTG